MTDFPLLESVLSLEVSFFAWHAFRKINVCGNKIYSAHTFLCMWSTTHSKKTIIAFERNAKKLEPDRDRLQIESRHVFECDFQTAFSKPKALVPFCYFSTHTSKSMASICTFQKLILIIISSQKALALVASWKNEMMSVRIFLVTQSLCLSRLVLRLFFLYQKMQSFRHLTSNFRSFLTHLPEKVPKFNARFPVWNRIKETHKK